MTSQMIRTTYFESLLDRYPILRQRYQQLGRNAPDVAAIGIDEFYGSFSSNENFDEELMRCVLGHNELLELKKKNIYLCTKTRGHGGTDRVRAYYGVWKTLAHVGLGLDCLETGAEYLFHERGHPMFGGVARVDYTNLSNVFALLVSSQRLSRLSFIFATSEYSLTKYEKTKHLFDLLTSGDIGEFHDSSYDFSNLLDNMDVGASILLVQHLGGECAADFLIKRS
jgi:hypothetical protein